MIDYASNHKEELRSLFIEAWRQDKYKYLFCNPYTYLSWLGNEVALENTSDRHHFVSMHKGKVIGYITYGISRIDNRIYKIELVNFSDNTIAFAFDLKQMLQNFFELYKFRKITFLVIIGNPIETAYDKLVEKYNGRVVGIKREHIKLTDGKYYDVKEYEVFREGYYDSQRI